MPKSLLYILIFHLILQNKSVCIWIFWGWDTFLFCPIHGDFSSFQFASIRQMLCRVRSFFFVVVFLYFLFLFPNTDTLLETCECLWAVCLRVIIEFLRVQLLRRQVCATLWHPLGGRFAWAPPPSPRLSHSWKLHSHQSIREWGSTGQSTNQRFRIMTPQLSPACSTLRFLGEVSLLAHALFIQTDLRERCRNVFSVCLCFV